VNIKHIALNFRKVPPPVKFNVHRVEMRWYYLQLVPPVASGSSFIWPQYFHSVI